MALRSTMAELIDRTRGMIGDPSDPDEHFSDDDIQSALDRYQHVARYLELSADGSFNGSVWSYLTYYSPGLGDWETGAALTNGSYAAVAVTTAYLDAGRWTLTTTTAPPVYVSGSSYDIHSAAADLLEDWAGALARDFDFSADGSSFSRSQKAEGLRAQAVTFRLRGRIQTATMVRSDEGGNSSLEASFSLDVD